MTVLGKFGQYEHENYTMVPYRHYKCRALWTVLVTKKTEIESVTNTGYVLIAARNAFDAASDAPANFERMREDQRIVREMEKLSKIQAKEMLEAEKIEKANEVTV